MEQLTIKLTEEHAKTLRHFLGLRFGKRRKLEKLIIAAASVCALQVAQRIVEEAEAAERKKDHAQNQEANPAHLTDN